MVFIDVTTDGEVSREMLISGLKWFLWDQRISTVQRWINLSENTKMLRIKCASADYAHALALRIAKDLIDRYFCLVHRSPNPWIPDKESPFGYKEFRIQPIVELH